LILNRNNRNLPVKRDYNFDPYKSPEFLTKKIRDIDIQISQTSTSIFQAQNVRIRTLFSEKNYFLGGFHRRIIESSASNSLRWHQSRLIQLNSERNLLQDELDRINGKFWIKKARKTFFWIVYLILFILIGFIFFMGIFTAIYILPFAIILATIFFMLNRAGKSIYKRYF
tara:strand:+ start:9390 stop:9899 length:510 start_codon:yes stop_codon:yes gene_type:complete